MKLSQLFAKGSDNCEPRPFTHVETAFADGGNTTKFMKVFSSYTVYNETNCDNSVYTQACVYERFNCTYKHTVLHTNIVHVENVVSLFSSPSTSSQKVRKCGSHNFL